jgi:glyoxylase I family protein
MRPIKRPPGALILAAPDKTVRRRSSKDRSSEESLVIDRQDASTEADARINVATSFHGVRYQVTDVLRSVAFYTQHLGFRLEHQQPPAFANVSLGPLQILLSGPGASGSRPMPDGRRQEPGGWNRIVLRVTNLPSRIDVLKKAGTHFRNQMEVGLRYSLRRPASSGRPRATPPSSNTSRHGSNGR